MNLTPKPLLLCLSAIAVMAVGLRWLWFVSCYGIVLVGSAVALLSSDSLFSRVAQGRQAVESVGGMMNQVVPGMGQYAQQAAGNASPTQFLTVLFYVFVLALLFSGYWALAGRYQERGLATN